MMYPLVQELAVDGIPVTLTCRMLGFSKQAFYKWQVNPVTDREWADAHLINTAMSIHADDPTRGVATSGRHGRSFSLGIADAVTVLARTASQADAAATIIANAVDLPGHPAILRCPAQDLQPDSDLGARLVTRSVGELSGREIEEALEAGADRARKLLAAGLIEGAVLRLHGEIIIVATRALEMPGPATAVHGAAMESAMRV